MKSHGFTLIELVTVMLIVGILSAVAYAQFFNRADFDSRAFYDQALSTLRYAQKAAIAQRKYVCVAFTSNSISLSYGATSACGTALASASGAAYPLTNSKASFSGGAPSGIYFDPLGRASAAASISITGYSAASITVEAETGYVHP